MERADQAEHLTRLFMAMADPTRLRLLARLADEEISVSHLHQFLGASQPKVSRHLAYLRSAALVDTRREGKRIYYSLRWPKEDTWRSIIKSTLAAMESTSSDPEQRTASHTYAHPHTSEESRPRHNELDEFLL